MAYTEASTPSQLSFGLALRPAPSRWRSTWTWPRPIRAAEQGIVPDRCRRARRLLPRAAHRGSRAGGAVEGLAPADGDIVLVDDAVGRRGAGRARIDGGGPAGCRIRPDHRERKAVRSSTTSGRRSWRWPWPMPPRRVSGPVGPNSRPGGRVEHPPRGCAPRVAAGLIAVSGDSATERRRVGRSRPARSIPVLDRPADRTVDRARRAPSGAAPGPVIPAGADRAAHALERAS